MSNGEAWSSCVARATWQAEVLRATRRAFNMEIAAAGFEQNPFKWTGDRLSHAEVTYAWSWLAHGQWHRDLVDARADDLNANDRLVPRPPSLRSDDEALFAELQRVTADAFLCTYLGKLQGSNYGPEPGKWTSGKTKATVWHE